MNATAAPRKRTRTFGKHAWFSVLGGLVMALAMAGVVDAYWAAGGTGSGSGPVGTLAAPTLSGSAGAGTATLTWTAAVRPSGGSDTISYYVSRGVGNVGGDCPTSPTPSVFTCTDSGLTKGDYSYTVTAVWQSWTATSSSLPVAVASGALDHFVLVPATPTPTAGQTDALTITAVDAANHTATSYIGSHDLIFSGASTIGSNSPTVTNSGGAPTIFGTATAISFTAGVSTLGGVMRLYKAETATVQAQDGVITGTAGFTVGPTGISSFRLAAATTTPSAGVADNLTITALDQYGNTATSYIGSHDLIFSGASTIGSNSPTVTNSSGSAIAFGGATPITFTAGVSTVGGVMTLYKVETPTVQAQDGVITGTAGFAVSTAAAASYSLTNTSGNPLGAQTAGTAFSVKLTALDSYGNVASSYSGAKTIAWSGPGTVPGYPPIYPATATSVTFASGVGTATGITLYKAETPTLRALDSSAPTITGTAAFTVSAAAAAASFTIPTPATQIAKTQFWISITAVDAYGNTATAYTDTVPKCLSFSDPNGNHQDYPAQGNCAATQSAVLFTNGVAAPAPVTINNVSTATTLTVTDPSLSGLSGTTGPFDVNHQ